MKGYKLKVYDPCEGKCCLDEAVNIEGWEEEKLEFLLEKFVMFRRNPFSYPEKLIREYRCYHETAWEDTIEYLYDIAIDEESHMKDKEDVDRSGIFGSYLDDNELILSIYMDRLEDLTYIDRDYEILPRG